MPVNNAEHTALCRAALESGALAGFTLWPGGAGAFKTETGGFIKYGKKGGADILGIIPISIQWPVSSFRYTLGVHVEAEAKTGGGDQSKNQKAHQLHVIERNGGIYFVFHSVPEFLEKLRSINLDSFRKPPVR